MERRRTNGLYEGRRRLFSRSIQDISDQAQKSDQVRYIVLTGVHNPGPQGVVKELGMGHLDKGQEFGTILVHVKGVHGQVDTTTPQCRDQVFGGRANKDEAGNMTVRLHGAPQRLLRNMRKGVSIINDNPTIHLFVVPRGRGHLPNKEAHICPNGLDAPIAIGRQE